MTPGPAEPPFASLVLAAGATGSRHRLLLPEGDDERVCEAARRIVAIGLADVTVVSDAPNQDGGIDWISPAELAQSAGLESVEGDDDLAVASARFVRDGHVAGVVLGVRVSSGAAVRAGLRELTLASGRRRVAGSAWVDASASAGRQLIFIDPVVNVSPDAATLAEATVAAADVWSVVTGAAPKAAFLSSSTGGSGVDPYAELMAEAAAVTSAAAPAIEAAGPVQADVALVPAVAEAKRGGLIRGDAAILVFPTLSAANIGVKLAEHLGGARMCTFLTGLEHPYNDLSRGCRTDDIVGTAAVTVIQAAARAARTTGLPSRR